MFNVSFAKRHDPKSWKNRKQIAAMRNLTSKCSNLVKKHASAFADLITHVIWLIAAPSGSLSCSDDTKRHPSEMVVPTLGPKHPRIITALKIIWESVRESSAPAAETINNWINLLTWLYALLPCWSLLQQQLQTCTACRANLLTGWLARTRTQPTTKPRSHPQPHLLLGQKGARLSPSVRRPPLVSTFGSFLALFWSASGATCRAQHLLLCSECSSFETHKHYFKDP